MFYALTLYKYFTYITFVYSLAIMFIYVVLRPLLRQVLLHKIEYLVTLNVLHYMA